MSDELVRVWGGLEAALIRACAAQNATRIVEGRRLFAARALDILKGEEMNDGDAEWHALRLLELLDATRAAAIEAAKTRGLDVAGYETRVMSIRPLLIDGKPVTG